MTDHSVLKQFTRIKPYQEEDETKLPDTKGVFIIVWYGAKDSTEETEKLEYLHCAEAENIRQKAIAIIKDFKYEGFPRGLEYLIKKEDSQEKRIELLQQVKPFCKKSS